MSSVTSAPLPPLLASRASPWRARSARVFVGGHLPWRAPPPPRASAVSDVARCARKPVRLSKNKKNKKLAEQGRSPRRRPGDRGGASSAPRGGAHSQGGLSPRERVRAADHEARRWLGQHFLIDHAVILDAVDAADVRPGDRVLEIGPGTGNLTVELLAAGAEIDAVEKDRGLADKLEAQFRDPNLADAEKDAAARIRVHEADFLKWDVRGAFADVDESSDGDGEGATREGRRAKVVANIPYNITTDILKVLLPMGEAFSNMIFMFQEEVAQRLIRDEAGNSDYRPMSVRVHYYSEPYYVRPVPASCFDPPPNVESCLVGFRPRRRRDLLPLAGTERQFFAFVQACFAQKRKMLRNNLKAVCDEATIEAALEMLEKHPRVRAQELTMPEYVRLFNFVRERGQARGEVNAGAGRSEKESARERDAREKVERATERLVADVVGKRGEDG
jgi:ribosomal RNA small subunit methyltransferase A